MMKESLARTFQKFELSKKAIEGVDLSGEDIEEGIQGCNGSLAGKLIGEKIANFTTIKNFTNHAWGYPRKMMIIELGPNLFQFHLEKKKDRRRILIGGPWIMDN